MKDGSTSSATKPIRIGIALVQFPAPSETFIVTKVLGMLEAGFDVTIFAGKESPHWDRFEVLAGRDDIAGRMRYSAPTGSAATILFRGIPYLLKKLFRHPREFVRFLRFSWKNRQATPHGFLRGVYLRSVYVGETLDILHFEFDMQAIGTADIKKFLGCKLLISVRSTVQKTKIYYRYPDLQRWLFQYTDGFHFISHYLRDNMLKLGLSPSIRWWLVEPAIDVALFESNGSDSGRSNAIQILSVGRLAWAKGYEFALDAIAELVKSGVTVMYSVLGEGGYRDAIVFAANQHGLIKDGSVHLAGAVPREHVRTHMKQADIFLHSAVEEGFANAVIEAQAMGIPVVTSDAGGLPENVEDGVTGFVVPRRDPKAMAEKLALLAGDPALRKRMGEAGRKRAMELFDLRDQTEKFVRLYNELLDA